MSDPPELAGARTWFTEAAKAGHTAAQFNLGVLLADLLVPPKLGEARAWYTKAAQAGHTEAQNNLGRLLEARLDPPELAEARAWYTKAAQAGLTLAQRNLGRFLATGLPPPGATRGSNLVDQGRRSRGYRSPVQPRSTACHDAGPAGPNRGPQLVHSGCPSRPPPGTRSAKAIGRRLGRRASRPQEPATVKEELPANQHARPFPGRSALPTKMNRRLLLRAEPTAAPTITT
jgi:hypothetical protein